MKHSSNTADFPTGFLPRLTSRARWSVLVFALSFILTFSAVEGATDPERLVRQLGDSNFAVRSRAEEQLLGLGYRSYRAISEGIHSDDPEVRYRTHRLLKLLQRAAFADQKHLLRQNPWQVPEELAPGWDAFHQLLGDGIDSRELYAQILNSETDLMLSLTLPRWQLQFEKHCADLQAFAHQRRQVDLQPGSIAAILFLACHPDNLPSATASSVVYMLLGDPRFRDSAERSRSSDVLKTLIGVWIQKSNNSSPMQRLGDAAAFEIDAALEVARETIAGRQQLNASAIHLENSIFYLAKHGGERVIEELEALLYERQQLRGSPRSTEMDVQIRDAALVGLLHITNQDPTTYGYHELRLKKGYLYIGSSARFDSLESREAAMKRWREWRAENLRDPVPASLDAIFGELM